LDCHEVARDPFSASPSPITHATIKSELSNAAPKAWLSESPVRPFVNRPGVVGATWLEIPAGKRKLFEQPFHPAFVWLMFG